MVRVPLRYEPDGLIASGILFNIEMRGPGPVDFLVVTGAAITLLSPYDQVRLGMDPIKLGLRRFERRLTTIAGKGNAFKLPHCLISLPIPGPGGGHLDLEVPDLLLFEQGADPAGPRKGGDRLVIASRPRTDYTPSILGRDLLELHGLLLVVDFKGRSAYLEAK